MLLEIPNENGREPLEVVAGEILSLELLLGDDLLLRRRHLDRSSRLVLSCGRGTALIKGSSLPLKFYHLLFEGNRVCSELKIEDTLRLIPEIP